MRANVSDGATEHQPTHLEKGFRVSSEELRRRVGDADGRWPRAFKEIILSLHDNQELIRSIRSLVESLLLSFKPSQTMLELHLGNATATQPDNLLEGHLAR